MPRPRKPPAPPETYTVAIKPNLFESVLKRTLVSAVEPLYAEIAQLKQQQSVLVEALEQMQRNHTKQLQMLAESLRQSLAEDERS